MPCAFRYTSSRPRVVRTKQARLSAIWSGSSLTHAAGSAESATMSCIVRRSSLSSSYTFRSIGAYQTTTVGAAHRRSRAGLVGVSIPVLLGELENLCARTVPRRTAWNQARTPWRPEPRWANFGRFAQSVVAGAGPGFVQEPRHRHCTTGPGNELRRPLALPVIAMAHHEVGPWI